MSPHLPNRQRYENILTDQTSAIFAKQRRELGQILRKGSKPDAAFWNRVAKETSTNTSLLLLPVHERGGKSVSSNLSGIKERARSYALDHSKVLARQLNQTSKAAVQELIGQVKQQTSERAKNRLIDEGLKEIFGATRAETISVTEITAAYTAGQMEVVGDRDGIWTISERGKVCPKCIALNGKRRWGKGGWAKTAPNGSPLHIHCNCSILWDEAA